MQNTKNENELSEMKRADAIEADQIMTNIRFKLIMASDDDQNLPDDSETELRNEKIHKCMANGYSIDIAEPFNVRDIEK